MTRASSLCIYVVTAPKQSQLCIYVVTAPKQSQSHLVVEHGLILPVTSAVNGLGGDTCNKAASISVIDSKVHEPVLVAGLDSLSISTVHAGHWSSSAISEAGEPFIFYWVMGTMADLQRARLRTIGRAPGRVEVRCSDKIQSLRGLAGPLIVATNADMDNEKSYT